MTPEQHKAQVEAAAQAEVLRLAAVESLRVEAELAAENAAREAAVAAQQASDNIIRTVAPAPSDAVS
jgi:hypothetical protein